MAHDHSDMSDMSDMGDMGDMSMDGSSDSGVSSVTYQKAYWTLVGITLALFTLANIHARFLSWQRMRSKAMAPARPSTVASRALAAVTATLRELSSAPIIWLTFRGRRIVGPSTGKTLMILLNIAVLLVLSFHGFDPSDSWQFEDIGYRLGRITVCQLPLLFLLAGKRNLVSLLAGTSYERINWLHRWASRTMLLIATIHMGYWFADWNRYDFIGEKVQTDLITQRGLIAWAILVWIVFSSMTPIRGWAYELFVVQHIISFTAFVTILYYHIPESVRAWIWFSAAVFFLDRVLRALSYIYNNLCRHPRSNDGMKSRRQVWGHKATFAVLPGGCTKISILNPPISWKPGQHVFLTCHSLAPLQAHPFTISSLPRDGQMTFIVQSQRGGTKRFHHYVETSLPETEAGHYATRHVAIEGPYGHVRPLQQFDSVLLIAGSTGATFTTPLLRDMVYAWKTKQKIVTRRIKYVWVVKSGAHLDWFRAQLSQVIEDVEALHGAGNDIAVTISLFITCDNVFTSDPGTLLAAFHKSTSNESSGDQFACGEKSMELASLNRPKATEITVQEKSIPSRGQSSHEKCCCRGDVDESSTDAPICTCTSCGAHGEQISSSSDEASVSGSSGDKMLSSIDVKPVASTPLLHPAVTLLSGRPKVHDILRQVLEQAKGETAVVACGPKGLIDDVRIATVRLSDERAVNRGTGAQGIWLHTEAFGY